MSKQSTMQLALGTQAPEFDLPDTDGSRVSLTSAAGENGLLVAFICNHCPYVKHVRHQLADMGRDFATKGIGMVAISSNDIIEYPDDSPEMMAKEKAEVGYEFPYLFDESQDVAKAYGAACTPDFFLFDNQNKLVYRGQLDDSRPNSGVEASGADIRKAAEVMLAGQPPIENQKPSVGCGIKWKAQGIPVYAS